MCVINSTKLHLLIISIHSVYFLSRNSEPLERRKNSLRNARPSLFSPIKSVWPSSFPANTTHRSRARLIAARVGDYARETAARSGLGNCSSTADPYSPVHPLSPGLPMRCISYPPFTHARDVRRRCSLGTNTIDWLTCLVHLQSGLDYLSLNPVRSLSSPPRTVFSFRFPRPSPLRTVSFKLRY